MAPQVALAQSPAPTVHRFEPTRYHNTFSFAHAPVLRIKPRDRVVTTTIDAGGTNAAGQRVAEGPNPQTGPFYVEGAEPGDMLVVTFHRIDPNRETAYSSTLIAPYAMDPGYIRATEQSQPRDLRPGRLELPLKPMLGCVGTAPNFKEAVRTSTPGSFGGNMDYAGVVAGVTVMLPVYEPGALLFVGDGHAVQGHAEVVGTGLETSMEVEFSVDLVKRKPIGWPRLESADHIMVAGSARPLLEAFQRATTEMLRWLMADYGFDERTASMLMGAAAEYEVANVVDPAFTIVAKMPKSRLPPR
jgi:acetamidase/formamidase